jgi:hypothetical protein
VTRIGELGTTLTVTSNQRKLHDIPENGIYQNKSYYFADILFVIYGLETAFGLRLRVECTEMNQWVELVSVSVETETSCTSWAQLTAFHAKAETESSMRTLYLKQMTGR